MLAGLGIALMLLATYGLFAWQSSLDALAVLCVAGISLVIAQLFWIRGEPWQAQIPNGANHGSRREEQEV